jgi:hypothetical protein
MSVFHLRRMVSHQILLQGLICIWRVIYSCRVASADYWERCWCGLEGWIIQCIVWTMDFFWLV